MSLRFVAEAFNISKSTLARYGGIEKESPDLISFIPAPNIGDRKNFFQ